MKIVNLITFIFLFSFNISYSQIEEFYLGENLNERVIFQKIKEIKGELFKYGNEIKAQNSRLIFLFSFNEKGNKIKEQIYSMRKEKIITNFEFRYDNSDLITEDTEFDENGRTKYKCRYIYDKKGLLTERVKIKYNGKSGSTILYKYNENGYKELEEWYNKKGTIYEEKKFSYNENGLISEETHYNDEDKVCTHFKYYYDENKFLTEKVSLYADGNIYERWVYEYDVYGNRLNEKHFFSGDKPEYVLSYSYDELYNITESKLYNESGKIIKSIKYSYTYY